jgi:hypothetical protein
LHRYLLTAQNIDQIDYKPLLKSPKKDKYYFATRPSWIAKSISFSKRS